MHLRKRLIVVASVLVTLLLVAVPGWWLVPFRAPIASSKTAIFIAPHPDDETYGMAQTIRSNVEAGKHVIVVVLTDGEGSDRSTTWTVDVNRDGFTEPWDFGLYRRQECRRALAALGVNDVRFMGAASSRGASGLHDGKLTPQQVEDVVDTLVTDYPDATLYSVMRYIRHNPIVGDPHSHPDHNATCLGVAAAARAHGLEAGFFKVYVYQADWWKRWAPLKVTGGSDGRAAKREAVAAYGKVGSASTPRLYRNLMSDNVEYYVPLWLVPR